MIKGIHLITGLLNYSSVEARLFGQMLIIPPRSWQVLISVHFFCQLNSAGLFSCKFDICRMFCLAAFRLFRAERRLCLGGEHPSDKTESGIIKSN